MMKKKMFTFSDQDVLCVSATRNTGRRSEVERERGRVPDHPLQSVAQLHPPPLPLRPGGQWIQQARPAFLGTRGGIA